MSLPDEQKDALINELAQKDALIKELATALNTCRYELVTLAPRLSPTFRTNVQAAADVAKTALAKVPA
jgi:hypothetical protein